MLLCGFKSFAIKDSLLPSAQFDLGMISSANVYDEKLGYQIGLKFYIDILKNAYIGVDNVSCYSNKKFNWPGIGEYRYNSSINCLSILVGYNFFKRNQFNLRAGIKFNYLNYKSTLITDEPILKSYLVNNYQGSHSSLGFSTNLSYRLSGRFACFIDLNYMKIQRKNDLILMGAGVTYNLEFFKYN